MEYFIHYLTTIKHVLFCCSSNKIYNINSFYELSFFSYWFSQGISSLLLFSIVFFVWENIERRTEITHITYSKEEYIYPRIHVYKRKAFVDHIWPRVCQQSALLLFVILLATTVTTQFQLPLPLPFRLV